jgi:hypothetical protein
MDREDLRKMYEFQVNMTVFADTKAGGFILLFAGILSGSVGLEKLTFATAALTGTLMFPNIVALLAVSLLLVSLALLMWAIMPRGVPSKELARSVIFWRHIARHPNRLEYAKRLKALSEDDWIDQWAEQIYAVASIARAKFARLRDGVWVGLGGSSLMVLLFVIT